MSDRFYYTYILSNINRKVLYTGVTFSIKKRLEEHRNCKNTFVSKYKVYYLIYYEIYENVAEAIAREKQIKSWSRKSKNKLIASLNPELKDLSEDL